MKLVGDVHYHAYSYNDKDLAVFAAGLNPTPGYQNKLVQTDDGCELISTPPSGTVIQVVAMFSTCAQLDSGGNMRSINVKDANGTHKVEVFTITEPKS